MGTETKFRWAMGIAVVLVLGLLTQGYLLWQTRQQLAALDPDSETLSPIEERILAGLDEQERPVVPDPWGNSLFNTDPFTQMRQMQQRMDSLFGSWSASSGNFTFSTASPEIELKETEEDYRIVIKVPQEQEVDLNTQVEDREVTVSGKISGQSGKNGNGVIRQFSSHSQFARTFKLPSEVDEVGVHSRQTVDGLTVFLPKKRV